MCVGGRQEEDEEQHLKQAKRHRTKKDHEIADRQQQTEQRGFVSLVHSCVVDVNVHLQSYQETHDLALKHQKYSKGVSESMAQNPSIHVETKRLR